MYMNNYFFQRFFYKGFLQGVNFGIKYHKLHIHWFDYSVSVLFVKSIVFRILSCGAKQVFCTKKSKKNYQLLASNWHPSN